jgi:hypothetical protein
VTFQVEAGSFQKPNATTGPQTVTVNGDFSVGPVLALIWISGGNVNNTVTGDIYGGNGCAAKGSGGSITQRCSGYRATDLGNPTESSGYYGTASCVCIPNAAGSGLSDQAHITAFANGSFTINWDVCAARQVQVNYLLIGGLGDAIVIDAPVPTATGNQDYTSSSFGTPDMAIVASAALRASTDGAAANLFSGFGFMNAALEQWSLSWAVIDNASTPSDTASVLRSDKAQASTGQTSGTLGNAVATIVGMITDGVRLNYTVAGLTNTQNAGWAVLVKGIGVKLGVITIAASPQTVTHGAAKTPLGLLLVADACTTINGNSQSGAAVSIGATDGTRQRVGSFGADDNIAPSTERCLSIWRNDKCIEEYGPNNLNSVEHSGSASAIGATTFTLTHDMTVGVQVLYAAFYDPASNTHELVNAA